MVAREWSKCARLGVVRVLVSPLVGGDTGGSAVGSGIAGCVRKGARSGVIV